MKSFSFEDQQRFARLSGDYNPLHLDALLARRLLFGEPVVHGVHLAMWSLEEIAKGISASMALQTLDATFHKPAPLDTPLAVDVCRLEANRYQARCTGSCCDLTIQLRPATASDHAGPALPAEVRELPVRDQSLSEAAGQEGHHPLSLDPAELQAMFPAVAQRLPAMQVAGILATSRLTGMECPGSRSVFHHLELEFGETQDAQELHYHVCSSDARFSRLQLAVDGGGMQGTLSTFVRPTPVVQPSLAEVAAAVEPGRFAGRRVLVVGGSRGLGEVAAKIAAAGGAEVRLTYHRGRQDAQRVVDELRTAGAVCDCFPLDVTQPVAAALGEHLGNWRTTDLYYFATPYIGRGDASEPFSAERFARFASYYVEGLSAVMEELRSLDDGPLAVFYPSTVLVESPTEPMAEYIAAKAAGEALCRSLQAQSRRLTCRCPRLPRVRTDQTVGIQPRKTTDPLEVLLAALQ